MHSPRTLIEKWVEHFNAGNAEKLAELYHEDATNHQVVFPPVVGRRNIAAMFRTEFARAEMTCIVENIFCDGEWGILEWRDPLGLRGCGFFQVVSGKIKFQRGYWDRRSFEELHGKSLG
jgi:hypothetical protein